MPKRKSYTVKEKLEAVTRVKQRDETEAYVSRDNGIPELTLRSWIMDEQKMCDFVNTVDSSDGRKRNKAMTASDPELGKLFTVDLSEIQAETPVSGPVRSVEA